MSRLLHTSPLARRLLPITIGFLVITTFLPPAVGAWPAWFGRLVRFFIAPISQPVRGLAGWLSPAEQPRGDDQVSESLRLQAEGYRQQLLIKITSTQQKVEIECNDRIRIAEEKTANASKKITLSAQSGYIFIDGKNSDRSTLTLDSDGSELLKLNQKAYRGTLLLTAKENTLTLLNRVGLPPWRSSIACPDATARFPRWCRCR